MVGHPIAVRVRKRIDKTMHFLRAPALALVGLMAAAPVWAQTASQNVGVPHNWELSFQNSHSPVQAGIAGLHSLVIWLMTLVTIFVAALLGYCMWKFRASKNPVASRVSHHTVLEVAWTTIPVLILIIIAIPSFRLVYFQDRTDNADLTVKVVGHQWYWEYQYPDNGEFSYNSQMIPADEIKLEEGQIRNLSVDNRVVVPANKNIRLLVTSGDVIHSFFIPSLGVQRYAIPGRTIETWVRVDGPGIYYGQCNQICGTNHSAMPIAVEALNDADFAAWIIGAKKKFAQGTTPQYTAIDSSAMTAEARQ